MTSGVQTKNSYNALIKTHLKVNKEHQIKLSKISFSARVLKQIVNLSQFSNGFTRKQKAKLYKVPDFVIKKLIFKALGSYPDGKITLFGHPNSIKCRD